VLQFYIAIRLQELYYSIFIDFVDMSDRNHPIICPEQSAEPYSRVCHTTILLDFFPPMGRYGIPRYGT
jgi:hypothetical protein